MLKKLAGVLALLSLCSCSPTPRLTKEEGTYIRDEPRNTASYQVQDGETLVGYVHRYEWESRSGQDHHHHLVYDAMGNPLGQVREDGRTYRYLPNGESKFCGNKDLREAIGIVFGSESPLRMVGADVDGEFVAWRKSQEAKRLAPVSLARAEHSSSSRADSRKNQHSEDAEGAFGFEDSQNGGDAESAFGFEDFGSGDLPQKTAARRPEEPRRPVSETRRPEAAETRRPEAAETRRPEAAETRRPEAAETRRPAAQARGSRTRSGQGSENSEEWPEEDEPWPGQK